MRCECGDFVSVTVCRVDDYLDAEAGKAIACVQQKTIPENHGRWAGRGGAANSPRLLHSRPVGRVALVVIAIGRGGHISWMLRARPAACQAVVDCSTRFSVIVRVPAALPAPDRQMRPFSTIPRTRLHHRPGPRLTPGATRRWGSIHRPILACEPRRSPMDSAIVVRAG